MGAEMWAVVLDETGRLSEVRAQRPVPASGEVLVRVLAAGCDMHDLAAWVKGPLAGAMPAGACPVPALVGTVEQTDPEHSALMGRPVAVVPAQACCKTAPWNDEHPPASQQQSSARPTKPWLLAEWVSVPADCILPLSPGRPLEEATLLGLAAGTLSAVRKASVEIGESVAVLGTELALILAAQWVRVAGAYDVYIVDEDPRGLALARQLWLGERIDAGAESASAAMRALREGHGVDLAILFAGDAERLRLATSLVKPGGRVLALNTTTVAALKHDDVRLVEASATGPCASRLDWEIAARTWGSGRLALRGLIAERMFVQELVSRANAGLAGDEGFMVALAPDRA